MILVNRNFGNYALSQAIGDMFKGSTDTSGAKVAKVNNTNVLATNSTLVSALKNFQDGGYTNGQANATVFQNDENAQNVSCNNFYLVTEHFLKTLDKVYTKIWNESFTETGIYIPANLATLFYGFATGAPIVSTSTEFMLFKKFVDRCITAGVLVEEDRLQYEDQVFLSGMTRANLSTQIDLDNKLITLTNSTPIDIIPDINAMTGQYLNGKKLFLMVTPYLPNESIAKSSTYLAADAIQEPFQNTLSIFYRNSVDAFIYMTDTAVKRPLAFFKPKTDASKFGRSLPLATHLIWSIGTPADKELAILEGKPVPDLIFDHLDRISHIDSLVLKIKFDKLQF